ncbi:MAG TPA: hypothetical protein VL549_11795 [Gemmatimonadales bacterium]|nr:hypothetical protein [Gemmatimonadales bacterium]
MPAGAVSVAAHVAVAILVLWRGAVSFDSSSGGDVLRESQEGGRPAMTWVVLPAITSLQTEAPSIPSPRITVPAAAAPMVQPVRLDGPPRVLAITQRMPLPIQLPDSVGIDEGVSPDSGQVSNCGGARQVSPTPTPTPSPRPGTGPGSDGNARDMLTPAGEEPPPDDQREHDVQFWIRADGRVKRIAVSPPIRDPDYRRRFKEAMSSFVFGPVQMPDGRAIDYVYSCVVYQ